MVNSISFTTEQIKLNDTLYGQLRIYMYNIISSDTGQVKHE